MAQQPVLYVREGTLAGQSLNIETDDYMIGRGSTCDLTLPERQVSRYHAQILQQDDGYVLKDLGSRNGTHLNGEPVTGTVPLHDGDEIQIAFAVKMVFIGTDATIPLTFEPPEPEKRLTLDEDKRTVLVGGNELVPPLSLAQFRLIKTLFDADGSVVDRDAIVNAVWPGTEGIGVSEQAIDALIRRLRDRLSEIDDHSYVVTVRGHGFRLDNEALES